jgi:hypothetical protein
MEYDAIDAYLRTVCSALDFDIGELWQATKDEVDGKPKLAFKQLYTNPAYEDFHSLVVRPDSYTIDCSSVNNRSQDENKHKFSPIICRGVCDKGQVVWANTTIKEGLTGRVDLPLNTAVGIPICSVGFDLYIVVLFAVALIPPTPASVEFLCSVAKAITSGPTCGFVKVTDYNSANVGLFDDSANFFEWDMMELIDKYSTAIDFTLLPITRIQKFFDCQEILLICEFFREFKNDSSRCKITPKQLEYQQTNFRPRSRSRGDSITSTDWTPTMDFACTDNVGSFTKVDESGLTLQSLEYFPACSHVPTSGQEPATAGQGSERSVVPAVPDLSANVSLQVQYPVQYPNQPQFRFKFNQSRFNEFIISILGVTIFDCAEMWLVSPDYSELVLESQVYKNRVTEIWSSQTKGRNIKLTDPNAFLDLPGRVLRTGRNEWDGHYCSNYKQPYQTGFKEEPVDNLRYRERLAAELGIRTAFGVSIPGAEGSVGCLAFYSSRFSMNAEPLIVNIIERAMQFIVLGCPRDCGEGGNVAIAPGTNFGEPLPIVQPKRQRTHSFAPVHGFGPFDGEVAAGGGSSTLNGASAPLNDPFSASASFVEGQMKRNQSFDRRLEMCRFVVAFNPLVENASEINNLANGFSVGSEPLGDGDLSGYTTADNASLKEAHEGIANTAFVLQEFGHFMWRKGNGATSRHAHGHEGMSFKTESANASLFDGMTDMLGDGSGFHGFHEFGVTGGARRGSGYDSCCSSPDSRFQILDEDEMLDLPMEHPPARGTGRGATTRKRSAAGSNGHQAVATSRTTVASRITPADPGVDNGLCRFQGCDAISERHNLGGTASQFCTQHKGTKQCLQKECNKCSQGGTSYCISHGGGRRCTMPGCIKGARDKFFCAAHGGGKRCAFSQGCGKSAVGASNFCTGHGGGKRCMFAQELNGQRVACTKSSQSNTNFCVKHGGGRLCSVDGCFKVARGKTDYCAGHGGGVRCKHSDCGKLAIDVQQLCRVHGLAQKKRDAETEALLCLPLPSSSLWEDSSGGAKRNRREATWGMGDFE